MTPLRKVLKYCFIGIGILLLSCHQPNLVVEIDDQIQKLIDADRQEDIKKVVSLYDKEAVLMPPSGEEIGGIKAIEKHYTNLFESYDFNDLGFESHETKVSDNWAVNIGRTKGLIVFSATDSSWQVNDKYMMLFRKNNSGDWKIYCLIWNKNP